MWPQTKTIDAYLRYMDYIKTRSKNNNKKSKNTVSKSIKHHKSSEPDC